MLHKIEQQTRNALIRNALKSLGSSIYVFQSSHEWVTDFASMESNKKEILIKWLLETYY